MNISNFIYTKVGKIIAGLCVSGAIFMCLLSMYRAINQKIIRENEENKGKSLLSFIDRWVDSLYNWLRECQNVANFNVYKTK